MDKAPEIAQQYLEKTHPLKKEVRNLTQKIEISNDIDKKLIRSVTESIIQKYELIAERILNIAEPKVSIQKKYTISLFYISHNINTNKGIRILEKLAQANYPPAQAEIAKIYFNGKIVEKNNVESLFWFLRAEQNGMKVSHYVKQLTDRLTKLELFEVKVKLMFGAKP